MYISKVTLKNIRGFTDLQFDLTRDDGTYAGWTVFTGDNGSGKTSLLKAIAVGLIGKDTARRCNRAFTAGFGTAPTMRPSSNLRSCGLRRTMYRLMLDGRRPPNFRLRLR